MLRLELDMVLMPFVIASTSKTSTVLELEFSWRRFCLILELLGFLWRLWVFGAPCGLEIPLPLLTECVSLIFISLLPCVIAFIWAVVLSSVLAFVSLYWNVSLFPGAIASFRTLSEFNPNTSVSRNISSLKSWWYPLSSMSPFGFVMKSSRDMSSCFSDLS